MTGKILCIASRCLFDNRNGAGVDMRNMLEALGGAGWDAQAFTMTAFTGNREYPIGRVIGQQNVCRQNQGRVLGVWHNNVFHRMFYTSSTLGNKIKNREHKIYNSLALDAVKSEKPDIVIIGGENAFTRDMINKTSHCVNIFIFYISTTEEKASDIFDAVDHVVVPTTFLSQYYREAMGINAHVLPTIVREDQYAPPEQVLGANTPSLRDLGFITFINPLPQKGMTIFWRIMETARRERPDLTFLAVEGRLPEAFCKAANVDLGGREGLWWIPNQEDIRSVYRRTSLLLFPSVGPEAAGRCVAEAQLGGIPVLGANHSGIVDQLNGGGFALDVPENCRKNPYWLPRETAVRPWVDTIYKLMDDRDFYEDSVARAMAAAERFKPARTKREVVAKIENLPGRQGPRPELDPTPPHKRPNKGADGAG